jgi:hypothetical protein
MPIINQEETGRIGRSANFGQRKAADRLVMIGDRTHFGK